MPTLRTLQDEASRPQGCDAGRFIESGLRAARHARKEARPAILADVADLLDCAVEDLGFLFARPVRAANDSDPVTLPEYRHGPLPAARFRAAE